MLVQLHTVTAPHTRNCHQTAAGTAAEGKRHMRPAGCSLLGSSGSHSSLGTMPDWHPTAGCLAQPGLRL